LKEKKWKKKKNIIIGQLEKIVWSFHTPQSHPQQNQNRYLIIISVTDKAQEEEKE